MHTGFQRARRWVLAALTASVTADTAPQPARSIAVVRERRPLGHRPHCAGGAASDLAGALCRLS